MTNAPQSVTILGAGLVGSLLALNLHEAGFKKIEIFEKRPDPRQQLVAQGRSINLALSDRGILALKKIGLHQSILEKAVPMRGRMIHDTSGNVTLQPYHHQGKEIYSISRAVLNHELINKVEQLGITIGFGHECQQVDFKMQSLQFSHGSQNFSRSYEYVFGTDGAYSALRKAMQVHQGFDFSQKYLDYGYKELHIDADQAKEMELHALHIWPRRDFMMIALPNNDGSFTATLFLRLKGENSFDTLPDEKSVAIFFEKFFPDVVQKIDDLQICFLRSPVGHMVTIMTSPWAAQPNACLLGDAAHAIVPFYGQGMNAGFESVRLLSEALADTDDFQKCIADFANHRVLDTNAIAALAELNFIEMRDLVTDPKFILRKKIEAYLTTQLPAHFHTIYEQVTFSDQPYSHALIESERQQKMFQEMYHDQSISENWESEHAKERILAIAGRYYR